MGAGLFRGRNPAAVCYSAVGDLASEDHGRPCGAGSYGTPGGSCAGIVYPADDVGQYDQYGFHGGEISSVQYAACQPDRNAVFKEPADSVFVYRIR